MDEGARRTGIAGAELLSPLDRDHRAGQAGWPHPSSVSMRRITAFEPCSRSPSAGKGSESEPAVGAGHACGSESTNWGGVVLESKGLWRSTRVSRLWTGSALRGLWRRTDLFPPGCSPHLSVLQELNSCARDLSGLCRATSVCNRRGNGTGRGRGTTAVSFGEGARHRWGYDEASVAGRHHLAESAQA